MGSHHVGSSVRLYALLKDAFTGARIESGMLPVLEVKPPGASTWTAAQGTAWVLGTDPSGGIASVTGLYLPVVPGLHVWRVRGVSPYTFSVPDSFVVGSND